MELSEIIKKISGDTGIDETEIKEKVEKKQEELGGLITPEGAAHIVANENGINLFKGSSSTGELKIENIIPNMKSVDVVGRVSMILPMRKFEKKDGKAGRVQSLFLNDQTGSIKVVFWDNDVELFKEKKIKEDDILKIQDGYTKEDLNGLAEIHIGNRTRTIINPKDVDPESIPKNPNLLKKMSELKEGDSPVDVLCKVLRLFEVREFEKSDGSTGRVVNLVVGDETKTGRLALWDEDVALVEKGKIAKGDTIKIKKGYVKFNFNQPEVNVGSYGKVVLEPSEGKISDVKDEYTDQYKRKELKDLKEGERAEVRCTIVDIYSEIKTFERKDGSNGMVINAILDDGTGNMRAAFYDNNAENLLNIKMERVQEGDYEEEVQARINDLLGREVVVKVFVRYSEFSGRNELVINDIDLNPDPKEEIKALIKSSDS